MGVCSTKMNSVDFADLKNKEIDDQIKKEQQQHVRKLLLLGAGECGKTTILKQMRLLSKEEFTEPEIHIYKRMVFHMIITSMNTMLEKMKETGAKFEHSFNKQNGGLINSLMENRLEYQPIRPETCEALKLLWLDSEIQQIFAQKDKFHFDPTIKYFLENITRISEHDYKPTLQDILNVRSATMGVQEVTLQHKDKIFRVMDVGGQKSQRRKWIHAFEDVDAMIFITAICEFNQTMREDGATNRLLDSFTLFGEMAGSEWFKKSSMILFFNKMDLFRDKLTKGLSLKSAFPEYNDETGDYEKSVRFLKHKFTVQFTERSLKSEEEMYIHETCATDTSQVQVILYNVIDMVLNKKMTNTGL